MCSLLVDRLLQCYHLVLTFQQKISHLSSSVCSLHAGVMLESDEVWCQCSVGGGGSGLNEKLIIGGNPVAAELGSNEIVEHAHYWIRF